MSKPEQAQNFLAKYAGSDLGHMMGTAYSKLVLACLTGKVEDSEEGNVELNFQRDVLDILECLARQEVARV
jgi:hypothetical protein